MLVIVRCCDGDEERYDAIARPAITPLAKEQEAMVLLAKEQEVMACQVLEALAMVVTLEGEVNPCRLSSFYPAPLLHLKLGGK